MSQAFPPPAGAAGTQALSEAAGRKLRIWRAIVKGSLAMTGICLTLEVAFFLWPAAPKTARIVVGAILVESFLTAVVVGAFGKCPACGHLFGIGDRRLTPDRCGTCGVALT